MLKSLPDSEYIWLLFLRTASRIALFALAISSALARPRAHDDRAEYQATIMTTDRRIAPRIAELGATGYQGRYQELRCRFSN